MIGLFLEISRYRDSNATDKINGFSLQFSLKTVIFYIDVLMENSELVVAEENKFEKRAK